MAQKGRDRTQSSGGRSPFGKVGSLPARCSDDPGLLKPEACIHLSILDWNKLYCAYITGSVPCCPLVYCKCIVYRTETGKRKRGVCVHGARYECSKTSFKAKNALPSNSNVRGPRARQPSSARAWCPCGTTCSKYSGWRRPRLCPCAPRVARRRSSTSLA